MIINFSVQNFGSIKEKQTLSFEATKSNDLEEHYIISAANGMRLLKLGLIYGANASGKSTILKALDFLRMIVLEPANKKTDEIDFTPFLFDAETQNQSTILSIDFIQNNIRYYYEVELNKKAIVKEELNFYKPNKANVFRRKTNLQSQFTEIRFGNKIKKDKTFDKILEANTLWNNTVLGGFLKTNIDFFELKEVTDWFSKYLSSLINIKTELDVLITSYIVKSKIKKENLVEILKKADFNISNILIKGETKHMPLTMIVLLGMEKNINAETVSRLDREKFSTLILEFEHTIKNNSYVLPFDLESEGTKKYYGFAGILSILINNSVSFFIDELEASMHPDLFTHFILSFLVNAKKSQLLATTHNRELLNNKDIFRNDVIWFTEKNEMGATELFSLADFDTSVIRDTSSVYNAYKIGKLGAVPNLGDYYINMDNPENNPNNEGN